MTGAGAGGQSVSHSFVVGDVVLVRDVTGSVRINTQRPPYQVEEYAAGPLPLSVAAARSQPARLLQPRYAVVPFIGRDAVINDLAAWLGDESVVSVRLIHAAGGQGKTRLAGHLAAVCAASGWAVWRLHHSPTQSVISQAALPSRGGVLAVVDYADRWPMAHLLALLTDLQTLSLHHGTVIRILLLARSGGFWWPALVDRLDAALAVDAADVALTALGEHIDPVILFSTARQHFAERLEVAGTEFLDCRQDLPEDTLVLGIHMAALVSVDAHRLDTRVPIDAHQLSAYLLRREYTHWQLTHARNPDPVQTSAATMRRAVYLATLTGAQSRKAARAMLAHTSLASTPEAADQIIDDHRASYPATTPSVFEPLHPDRLGEDFLALTDPRNPHHADMRWLCDDWAMTVPEDLLATQANRTPPNWAPETITTLVETAHRWPHIATEVLYPLLRNHPELALAAGGPTIVRITTLDNIDPDTLTAIDAVLPTQRHVDLDTAAAALTPLRLANSTDPAQHAHILTIHAWRQHNAGRHDQALPPAEEAAAIHRQLAHADPAAHLPSLAGSLSNLGAFLLKLGRRGEALARTEEAVAIRRRLAEANPAAHLPDLAGSLSNLGLLLSELGRHDEALGPAEEAAAIYRRLARANPAAHLPDLGVSLSNLGLLLSRLGRHDEALPPTEEAVAHYRRLARANPAAHLPDLGASVTNLGLLLSRLGRHDEAMPPTEEAVVIRRQLADANPAAYLRDLAGSVTNLGRLLSKLGRRDEALLRTEEAAVIQRQLADANPAAYLPDLGASLSNLGLLLSELGRGDEALPYTEEAVAIRRQLADANPAAHLPDLAASLTNLGLVLSELGRHAEGLAPAEEAVTHYRRLADANPAAHLPNPATSLTNLGIRLSRLGQRDEALPPAAEAVAIRRQLAQTNPAAHLPDLATSVNNLANRLSELGRHDEALHLAEEAVAIRRQLAHANPVAYLPELAMSLNNLGAFLSQLDRQAEALPPAAEAVAIRRQLAQTNPAAYLPNLARSLMNLGNRLSELGRRDEALPLAEEAVAISRLLAQTNPAAYLPDLAMSLWAYASGAVSANASSSAGERAAREAAAIFGSLTEQLPQRFAGYLVSSCATLADVLDGLGQADEAAIIRYQFIKAT